MGMCCVYVQGHPEMRHLNKTRIFLSRTRLCRLNPRIQETSLISPHSFVLWGVWIREISLCIHTYTPHTHTHTHTRMHTCACTCTHTHKHMHAHTHTHTHTHMHTPSGISERFSVSLSHSLLPTSRGTVPTEVSSRPLTQVRTQCWLACTCMQCFIQKKWHGGQMTVENLRGAAFCGFFYQCPNPKGVGFSILCS